MKYTIKNHRKAKPFQRKVHIGRAVWTYRVTSSAVIVRSPDCLTTYQATLPAFTGLSWDAIERAEWKHTNLVNIKPSDIKGFIQSLKTPKKVNVTDALGEPCN